MISGPFGLNEDGGAAGGGGGWGGRPGDIVPTNPGNAYQACYTIYSSARVKRGLEISDAEIVKRCRKAKREAEPEPLMIADPIGLGDGDLNDGGSGWDFGPDLTPTDVGNAYQAKRTAEPDPIPDPLMISDPFGLGNGDGGLGGGGDGGGPQWPGDVGDGFLQCYSVYISDKTRGLEVEGGLEKRCRKEKREAEDEVLRRDKEKYTDYEEYGIA
jgi:hypothetical protein